MADTTPQHPHPGTTDKAPPPVTPASDHAFPKDHSACRHHTEEIASNKADSSVAASSGTEAHAHAAHQHNEPDHTGHDHEACMSSHTSDSAEHGTKLSGCQAHTHTHDAHSDGHDHAAGHHDDHAGHDHSHHHGFGHHHAHTPASFGTAFAIGITLNLVYLAAEALWGVFSHSLALLADAGHNLSDVLALAAAWLAEKLSKRSPSARFTYGLRRSSILAALSNAVILLVVTGGVAWESFGRLLEPSPVAGKTVMIVAAIGILVNGGTAMLFASGQKNDLNIRGAFLHMMADAVTSLAVVIAGGLVLLTGLNWIDPAVSLAISALVVLTTWGLLRDSVDMALDAVPRSIDHAAVEDFLRTIPAVADLHDLHIWPISTTETALTVHLVLVSTPPINSAAQTALLQNVVEGLRSRFNIAHPTVQIEEACYAPSCHLVDPHTV
ncbi:Cobalt-zinc-cadmium resistance protein CzcD [Acetobacter tropicalis]|uniref:Cobalt-zinc-cadmium resistance protein CzcD n=2 Tax=Acetobacter tropicalis TaxID=104102 RepID=A0A094YTU4_9PROT|nr:Cobalt-zinc-cadmium resistance protein CzcD [Acetobacter tropicalis]